MKSDDTVNAAGVPIPFDYTWFFVAGVGVVALGVGAMVVMASRLATSPALDLLKSTARAPKSFDSPGVALFYRVLTEGVRDGELQHLRSGMTNMLYFHKTFNDARLLGISPTELAVSGRYFGEEVLPIRIEIQADGSMRLPDGRRRYAAAKEAGAGAILADVVLYDNEGDVLMERRSPVSLL